MAIKMSRYIMGKATKKLITILKFVFAVLIKGGADI